MTRILSILILIWLPVAATARSWETLTDCRLDSNPSNDGDSFHVRHGGKDYVFRLYFVDSPETDTSLEDRLKEQEQAWRCDRRHLMRAGAAAARFTRERLSKPFTVHTCWKDAKGSGDPKRFFAFVEFEPGKFLCEALVAEGHARVYGASDRRPDGKDTQAVWDLLEKLQRQARARKLGAWAPSDPMAAARAPAGDEPETLVVENRVELFSLRNPGQRVGALRPGASVAILGTPNSSQGLVHIRFSTDDGSQHEALARSYELGLTPNPFLPR